MHLTEIHLLGYIVLALFVAYACFATTYRLNGGSDSIPRELRRSFWLALPGKYGNRARNSWTRKQARQMARMERIPNTIIISSLPAGSWRKIAARGPYEPYHSEFCFGRAQLLEALAIGFLWPAVLLWIILVNTVYAVAEFGKWLRQTMKRV